MCFIPLLPPRSRRLRMSRSGLSLAPIMNTTKSPSISAVPLPMFEIREDVRFYEGGNDRVTSAISLRSAQVQMPLSSGPCR